MRVALGLSAVLVIAFVAALWSVSQMGFWELVVAFFRRLGWFAIIPLIAPGIWHHQGMDDPMYSSSTQAKTSRQAVIHNLFYKALLYIALRLVLGPLSIYY